MAPTCSAGPDPRQRRQEGVQAAHGIIAASWGTGVASFHTPVPSRPPAPRRDCGPVSSRSPSPAPIDDTGFHVHELRTDDLLAGRDAVPGRLADRRWFRLPDGIDPL